MRPEPLTLMGPAAVNAVLERLQDDRHRAVLSGDWAARHRLGTVAPYRLELIISPEDLDSLVASHGAAVDEKPGHYRLQLEGVEVTLLLAGEARLGEVLQLPAAALAEHAEMRGNRRTLSAEGVFAQRMASLLDRPDNRLAERDRGDLWALAAQPGGLDWGSLASMLSQTQHSEAQQKLLLRQAFHHLAELEDLGRHRVTRIWGWQREALDAVDETAASAAAQARLAELADKERTDTLSSEERRQQRILNQREARQQRREDPLDPLFDSPSRDPDRELDR